MANAVTQGRLYETEGTTGTSAEGGLKLNREAGVAATAVPIPIPTATGTKYSWRKPLALHVTTASSPTTNISNRTIAVASAPATGLKLWVDPEATYTAPATGNMPADQAANDASPGGAYSEIITTAAAWHATAVSAGSTGRNGDFATVVLGVGFNYAGSAGTNIALPNILLGYDEA